MRFEHFSKLELELIKDGLVNGPCGDGNLQVMQLAVKLCDEVDQDIQNIIDNSCSKK